MKGERVSKPVFTPTVLVAYRRSLGMTQEQFACTFEVPIGTLRRWEQGVSRPNITCAELELFNHILEWKKERRE